MLTLWGFTLGVTANGDCNDQSSTCTLYISRYGCQSPSLQMFFRTNCRKTCNFCTSSTQETEADQLEWADWKECDCETQMQVRYRNCSAGSECIGGTNETRSCEPGSCSDGQGWSQWSRAGHCSRTCGQGSIRQARRCLADDRVCFGVSVQTVACNTHNCPGYGDGPVWTRWSKAGRCSKTCGSGIIREARQCINGVGCRGPSVRRVDCHIKDCDGPSWGSWEATDECSATCGRGSVSERRTCEGGSGCPGRGRRTVECNEGSCPSWSNWEDVGSCTQSCEGGRINQRRRCSIGPCNGTDSRAIDCSTQECLEWSNWEEYGECSRSCGRGRIEERRRCRYGNDCPGSNNRNTKSCNTHSCLNPSWSNWEDFGTCSVSCGGGEVDQRRICSNGPCSGQSSRTVDCNTQRCTEWTNWEEYGDCSRSCGGGRIEERRRCRYGTNCPGSNNRNTKSCNTQSCLNPSWSNWEDFGTCSVSCGGGEVDQRRICSNGPCSGQSSRTVDCNTQRCSASAVWSQWSSWSTCSITCGRGSRIRTRNCLSGLTCRGETSQERTCTVPVICPCNCKGGSTCVNEFPAYCTYILRVEDCARGEPYLSFCEKKCGVCGGCICGTWSNWVTSDCSASCGNGIRTRTRTCPNGRTCDGPETSNTACNLEPCNSDEQTSHVWGPCSRSCGWGTRTRTQCPSCAIEYQDCKNRDCPQRTCINPFTNRYESRSHECCDASTSYRSACGVNEYTSGRIIDGVNAAMKAWPWMVQLVIGNGICAGTLVSSNLVVTAAHCFRGKAYRYVRLRFGALYYNDLSPHVELREEYPAQVTLHHGRGFANDIAVIRLTRPVSRNGGYIHHICLPQGEMIVEDVTCVVAGWGTVVPTGENRVPSSVLQEAEVRTLPFGVCTQAYGSTSPDRFICAGIISGGADTCAGDSGGPLMCQRCSTCSWFLAGITSHGGDVCGAPRRPGVYTRVSFYQNWINQFDEAPFPEGPYESCP